MGSVRKGRGAAVRLRPVAALALTFLCFSSVRCLMPSRLSAMSTALRMALPPPPMTTGAARRAFEGQPSTPGWASGQLDKLTDWAVNDEANRPIICTYEPDASWLWAQWRGTVLSLTVKPVLLSMVAGMTVHLGVYTLSESSWPFLAVPPADDPLIQQLTGVNALWEYLLTLCTFILTFFTQSSYNHWKSVYFTTRAIQGRINDICLLITIGAERGPERCVIKEDVFSKSLSGANGDTLVTECVTGYSDEARSLVRRCSRLIRLSHTFFWAAMPTNSNGVADVGDGGVEAIDLGAEQAIGPLLLSARGLRRLVDEGELTANEREALLDSGLPPSQFCYILLEWVGLHVMNGIKDGTLRGDNGFEENLLRQFTALRAEYFNIGDYQAGRMPLAYVQLVQVLVDCLVVLAPLALYSDQGSLSVPLTGLLTLFFKGLLELSKSFLDPFGNEGYLDQNVRVDVLVSELNFGAGSRWVKAGEVLPSNIDSIDSVGIGTHDK